MQKKEAEASETKADGGYKMHTSKLDACPCLFIL